METALLWNWRLTVPETTKVTLISLPVTNLKMIARADCAVSACSPVPQPIKALAHWLSGQGESAFRQDRSLPTPPQLPASKVKQTFLSTNLASSLSFEWWTAGPHFSVTLGVSCFLKTKVPDQMDDRQKWAEKGSFTPLLCLGSFCEELVLIHLQTLDRVISEAFWSCGFIVGSFFFFITFWLIQSLYFLQVYSDFLFLLSQFW